MEQMGQQNFNFVAFCPNLVTFGGNFLGNKPKQLLIAGRGG
tara:strand:- start:174 stop:296 length:123 start_codon:yes stop_codon:yes gene_type:complete